MAPPPTLIPICQRCSGTPSEEEGRRKEEGGKRKEERGRKKEEGGHM
jgi:hypothetical protein